jgi:CubicO group peptidase (beta-lactamase class C family)
MDKRRFIALSLTVINDGRIVWSQSYGIKKKKTSASVDEKTVFRAASLSKTVFAYLVMQLKEQSCGWRLSDMLDLKTIESYYNEHLRVYKRNIFRYSKSRTFQ